MSDEKVSCFSMQTFAQNRQSKLKEGVTSTLCCLNSQAIWENEYGDSLLNGYINRKCIYIYIYKMLKIYTGCRCPKIISLLNLSFLNLGGFRRADPHHLWCLRFIAMNRHHYYTFILDGW